DLREETVVVLAEHDRPCLDALGGLDDLVSGLAGGPGEIGANAGRREDLACLLQVRYDVGRRRERSALARRDVVERSVVARVLWVERHVRDAYDGEAPVRGPRFCDRAVEGSPAALRSVVADEDPRHEDTLRRELSTPSTAARVSLRPSPAP